MSCSVLDKVRPQPNNHRVIGLERNWAIIGKLVRNIIFRVLNFVFGYEWRTIVISFGPVSIPPHTSKSLSQTMMIPFKGRSISNTFDVKGLSLESVCVGYTSQLQVFANNIPMSACDKLAVEMDLCESGNEIGVVVRNDTNKSKNWGMISVGSYPIRERSKGDL